jgi:translation initiation factor 2B subunit (eIF-2B alpha/beta/delta family)
MIEEIERVINSIRNDYENGSVIIANNAIDAFVSIVNSYRYDKDQIKIATDLIINSKPDMAALRNIMMMCLKELESLSKPYDFRNSAERIKNFMNNAASNLIENAIRIIKEHKKKDNCIITCSYSSTVINLFKKMNNIVNLNKIYALESISDGRDHARSVISSCEKIGIDSYHIKAKDLVENISHIDFAIIGADSYFDDGSVINGIPSLYLAEQCYQKIPFYCLAESFKKSTEKNDAGDGFDLIPPKLLTKIINEKNY